MVVVLKEGHSQKQLESLVAWLRQLELEVHPQVGIAQTILGLIGDTTRVDIDMLRALDIVADVKRIQEPYKSANRKFHPADTVITIGDVQIGGDSFQFMAGPCSVESREQIIEVAKSVRAAGARILRGGVFKPRTSPYAFQGLKGEGLQYLVEAKRETGMPIVTEVMNPSQLSLFDEVDIIQVGARNMQNFDLLRELGQVKKPVLLKRGLSSTLEEFLMSAEYIMASGNEQVILCERGIRTFETAMRNTLDLAAVPVLKTMTHLPVIVDPSHAIGIARFVPPLALAAAAIGADGLMIEVHNDPSRALCDGPQSLTPQRFTELVRQVESILPKAYREIL